MKKLLFAVMFGFAGCAANDRISEPLDLPPPPPMVQEEPSPAPKPIILEKSAEDWSKPMHKKAVKKEKVKKVKKAKKTKVDPNGK